MKCYKFVAAKAHSVPCVECGGVIVQPGDELVVREAIAKHLVRHYKGVLLEAGEVEKAKLASGHYELSRKSSSIKRIATDKSVLGKDLVKTKAIEPDAVDMPVVCEED